MWSDSSTLDDACTRHRKISGRTRLAARRRGAHNSAGPISRAAVPHHESLPRPDRWSLGTGGATIDVATRGTRQCGLRHRRKYWYPHAVVVTTGRTKRPGVRLRARARAVQPPVRERAAESELGCCETHPASPGRSHWNCRLLYGTPRRRRPPGREWTRNWRSHRSLDQHTRRVCVPRSPPAAWICETTWKAPKAACWLAPSRCSSRRGQF